MNYASWAKWYDLFYSTEPGDEAEFYLKEMLAAEGPVLEIGVGTGRIAIPAAQQGVEVFGIDASAEMLAVAESKARKEGPLAAELTLLQADMRNFDLQRKDFALVMIPAHTLLLATSYQEQLETLCCATKHVRPGGKLIFNLFNPTPDLIFDDSPDPIEIGRVEDQETGSTYLLSAINSFDTDQQINDALQIVSEVGVDGSNVEKERLPVRLRYTFAHEVFSMLEETQVKVETVLGWFDGSPFAEDSEEMIFVARCSEEPGSVITASS